MRRRRLRHIRVQTAAAADGGLRASSHASVRSSGSTRARTCATTHATVALDLVADQAVACQEAWSGRTAAESTGRAVAASLRQRPTLQLPPLQHGREVHGPAANESLLRELLCCASRRDRFECICCSPVDSCRALQMQAGTCAAHQTPTRIRGAHHREKAFACGALARAGRRRRERAVAGTRVQRTVGHAAAKSTALERPAPRGKMQVTDHVSTLATTTRRASAHRSDADASHAHPSRATPAGRDVRAQGTGARAYRPQRKYARP